MRVTVLGGNGFVGGQLCRTLTDLGIPVTAVVRPGSVAVPGPGRDVEVLTLGPSPLTRLFRRTAPDVVVNAAGAVWRVGADQMQAANVEFVQQVLLALRELDRPTRLIHLGTVHEYGDAPDGAPFVETMPVAPLTPYGRSKAAGAQAVLNAVQAGRADAVVLRLANVIGPGAPVSSLLGMVVEELVRARDEQRRAVVRFSSVGGTRDFVDIEDVIRAILAAARPHRWPAGESPLVNIGGGRTIEPVSLVRRLIEISEVPTDLVEEPAPALGPGARASGQLLDLGRAARTLDWRPERTAEEALYPLWVTASVRSDPEPAAIRKPSPAANLRIHRGPSLGDDVPGPLRSQR